MDQDPRKEMGGHHQNDSCIKMGSNQSHFNVSLLLWGKISVIVWGAKTVSANHNFLTERRAEAESKQGPAYQTNTLLLVLGQTTSLGD